MGTYTSSHSGSAIDNAITYAINLENELILASAATTGLLSKTDWSTFNNKLDSSTYNANDVLAKLLTVDGTGSGLDADLLDGNDSSYFAISTHNHDGVYEPILTKYDLSGNTSQVIVSNGTNAVLTGATISLAATPVVEGLEITSTTANTVPIVNSLKQIQSSSITNLELETLSSINSNIQNQLNKIGIFKIVSATNGDYTSLSEAITAGETKIYIKAGTYNETTNKIEIRNNNTYILGENKENININFTSDGELRLYASNCILNGFKVTAVNGAALAIGDGSVASTPIVSVGCNNIINDCKFIGGSTTFCFYMAGASYERYGPTLDAYNSRDLQNYNVVSNCYMESSFIGDGFVVALQKEMKFINNICVGARLSFYMNRESFCIGNEFTDSNGVGIYLAGVGNNNIINNNIVYNAATIGIKSKNESEHDPLQAGMGFFNNTISNNIIHTTGLTGLSLEGVSGFNSTNNDIAHNIIKNAGDNGIYLLYADQNNIFNNIIDTPRYDLANTRGSGIYIVIASNNTIHGNRIYDTRSFGSCSAGAIIDRENTGNNGNIIESNYIYCNNTEKSIWIQGDYTLIKNNYITGGYYGGIQLQGADHCIVQNNTCYNNTNWGTNTFGEIWLTDSADYNIVKYNHLESVAPNYAKYDVQDDSGSSNNIFGFNTNYECLNTHADNLILENNTSYQIKDSSGTAKNTVKLTNADVLEIGDSTGTINIPSLTASKLLYLDSNKNLVSTFDGQDLGTSSSPTFYKVDTIANNGTYTYTIAATPVPISFGIYQGEAYGDYGVYIGTRNSYPVWLGTGNLANINITLNEDGTTKFNNLTANTVPYIDSNKNIVSSAVDSTELGYLEGVTSAVQTQFNNLAAETDSIMEEIDTVANVKLLGISDNRNIYCRETNTVYTYLAAGSVYTANDFNILITADGGDTRWIAIQDMLYTNLQTSTFSGTGFLSRTTSTMSISGNEFTISAVSSTFDIYIYGTKHVKTSDSTTIPYTVGLHYIYYNESAVLTSSTTPWTIPSAKVFVAIVYCNGSEFAIQEERHGANRNMDYHRWAHLTIGTRYESGLTGTFSSASTSFTSGILHDEDINNTIPSQSGNCVRIWYRNPTNFYFSSTPVAITAKVNAGALQYDNSGTLTNVTNNYYVTNWIYACNDINYPIYCIVGQAEYSKQADAEAAPTPTFTNYPSAELKVIYSVTWKNASGTPEYISSRDFRLSSPVPGGGTVSTNASTVSFTPYLTVSSTNVQGAIQELVDEKIETSLIGNLTEDTSSVLTITGGTNATLGNVTIEVAEVSESQDGYLTAFDYANLSSTPLSKFGDTVLDNLYITKNTDASLDLTVTNENTGSSAKSILNLVNSANSFLLEKNSTANSSLNKIITSGGDFEFNVNSSNYFYIKTNNQTAFLIDPSQKSYFYENLNIQKAAAGAGLDLSVYNTASTGDSFARLEFKSDTAKLNIISNASSYSGTYYSLAMANLNYIISDSNSSNLLIAQDGNKSIYFGTNGNPRMFIDGSGNVNLPALTGSRALTIDSSKNITASVTTATELSYLSGATSNIQQQIDTLTTCAGCMDFKGVIDCSTNPNYPAADAGDTYICSADGKIGGASGKDVSEGDLIICDTDSTPSGDEAAVGTYWHIISANGTGSVTTTSVSSLDNAITRFDSTTGNVIQNSLVTIDDSGSIYMPSDQHIYLNSTPLSASDIEAEPTLTKGNLSEITSSILTITGGTNAVIGSGTTIQVKAATTSQSGYLTQTDWNTFNSKASNTHTHGNITNVGAIGSTSGLPVVTTTSGVLTTGTYGTLSGTTNQVNLSASGTNVLNGTSITLSLPQDIATTSSPSFADMSLTGAFSVGTAINSLRNIYVSKTFTDPSSTVYGAYIENKLENATTNRSNIVCSLTSEGSYNATGLAQNQLYGLEIKNRINSVNNIGPISNHMGIIINHGILNCGAGTIIADSYLQRGIFYLNSANATIDTSYLFNSFYIGTDTSVTNKWGLYIYNEDKNYISGNLGIGTNDIESWDSSFKAIEFSKSAIMGGDGLYSTYNAYYDGSWKYKTEAITSRLDLTSNGITFNVAASGTINTVISYTTQLVINNTGIQFQQLTASRVPYLDSNKYLVSSSVTSTELGYLSGVTSAIQTQINSKQATITGAATTVTTSDLTADRALISNGSGKIAVSSVTSTELGYVSGVTSAIQTQLNNKVTAVSSTDNAIVRYDGTSGAVQNSGCTINDSNVISGVGLNLSGLTASKMVTTDGSKNLITSYDCNQSVATTSSPTFAGLNSSNTITLNNNISISGKDSGGTSRILARVASTNVSVFGNTDLVSRIYSQGSSVEVFNGALYTWSMVNLASINQQLATTSAPTFQYLILDRSSGGAFTAYTYSSVGSGRVSAANGNGLLIKSYDDTTQYAKIDNYGLGIGTSATAETTKIINAQRDINNALISIVKNATDGTGSFVVNRLESNNSQYIDMRIMSESYTPAGLLQPDSGVVMTLGASNGLRLLTYDSTSLILGTANTERVTIDSSGIVRIGTTSATSYKLLTISNAGSDLYIGKEGSTGSQLCTGSGTYDAVINAQGSNNLQIALANNIALSINNSRNIGICTTNIEAWDSTYKAIEWAYCNIASRSDSGAIYINDNMYMNSGTWKCKTTAPAAQLAISSGALYFGGATSGTIDTPANISNYLTIDATGSYFSSSIISNSVIKAYSSKNSGYNTNFFAYDSTAQTTGVGGGITLLGKYTDVGDYITCGAIAAYKENSTSGNYSFGMEFFTRINGSLPARSLYLAGDKSVQFYGNVGIGTSPSSTVGLTLSKTFTNLTNANQFVINPIIICNSAGTYYNKGLYLNNSGSYLSANNSGYLMGIEVDNFYYSDSNTANLTDQYGIYSRTGIYQCGAGGSITNTYCYYGIIWNNDADGIITNAFLARLQYSGTSGTITNKWGLYIDGETKNYFSGNIGIGTNDIESWDSSFKALEFSVSAIMGGNSIDIAYNGYYDGSWKYKTNSTASTILIGSSGIYFRVAASGIANNAISWSYPLLLDTTGVQIFNQTASRVPYLDSNKYLVSSSVTSTELGYLSGVTSSIQSQLNTINFTSTLFKTTTYVDISGANATGSITIPSGTKNVTLTIKAYHSLSNNYIGFYGFDSSYTTLLGQFYAPYNDYITYVVPFVDMDMAGDTIYFKCTNGTYSVYAICMY